MREWLKRQLGRLEICPTKTLGQNFLADESIAERIVESAEINSEETVLEIGPGLGILTDYLIKKSSRTILVEKDPRLIGYLREKYGESDIRIIKGDVLEVELPDFDKVVSNLPFSISTPITFRLLKENFRSGVLTYQKQYAERMTASCGEEGYSRLSVMVSSQANVERLFTIRREKFFPSPEVDASVIKLEPSEPDFELKHPDLFSSVVKQLFNYRRKMIKNGLKIGFGITINDIPYGDRRIEELSPEEISSLVDHLVEKGVIE